MTAPPIYGRRCRWCDKVLEPHPGETVRAFNKRSHCDRNCSTNATKAVWHDDVRKIRKARQQ